MDDNTREYTPVQCPCCGCGHLTETTLGFRGQNPNILICCNCGYQWRERRAWRDGEAGTSRRNRRGGLTMIGTWCPECGYGVSVDEDGLCETCGASAAGIGARRAVLAVEQADNARAMAESARAAESAALERIAELETEVAWLRENHEEYVMVTYGPGVTYRLPRKLGPVPGYLAERFHYPDGYPGR